MVTTTVLANDGETAKDAGKWQCSQVAMVTATVLTNDGKNGNGKLSDKT